MANDILIIENDESTTTQISDALRELGYNNISAMTAEDALATVNEMVPSLIFVNLATPGTNGLEICKTIHNIESLVNVPIILLALREGKFDPVYTKIYGIVCFLKKPFETVDMITLVQEHAPLQEDSPLGEIPDDAVDETMIVDAGQEYDDAGGELDTEDNVENDSSVFSVDEAEDSLNDLQSSFGEPHDADEDATMVMGAPEGSEDWGELGDADDNATIDMGGDEEVAQDDGADWSVGGDDDEDATMVMGAPEGSEDWGEVGDADDNATIDMGGDDEVAQDDGADWSMDGDSGDDAETAQDDDATMIMGAPEGSEDWGAMGEADDDDATMTMGGDDDEVAQDDGADWSVDDDSSGDDEIAQDETAQDDDATMIMGAPEGSEDWGAMEDIGGDEDVAQDDDATMTMGGDEDMSSEETPDEGFDGESTMVDMNSGDDWSMGDEDETAQDDAADWSMGGDDEAAQDDGADWSMGGDDEVAQEDDADDADDATMVMNPTDDETDAFASDDSAQDEILDDDDEADSTMIMNASEFSWDDDGGDDSVQDIDTAPSADEGDAQDDWGASDDKAESFEAPAEMEDNMDEGMPEFADDSTTDDDSLPDFDMDAEDDDFSELFDKSDDESADAAADGKKKKGKKGFKKGGGGSLKKILVFVLLLMILGGGGFAGYTYYLDQAKPKKTFPVMPQPRVQQPAPDIEVTQSQGGEIPDSELPPADLLAQLDKEDEAKAAQKPAPMPAPKPVAKRAPKPAPAKAAPARATSTVTAKKGAYYVQFGVFGSKNNATKYVKRLNSIKLNAYVYKRTSKGKTVNFVLLEKAYNTRKSALKKAASIKKDTGFDTAVYRMK